MDIDEKQLFIQRAKDIKGKISLLVHSEARRLLFNFLNTAGEYESFSILGFIELQLENREEAIGYAALLYEADGFLPQNTLNNLIMSFSPFTEPGWPFNIHSGRR